MDKIIIVMHKNGREKFIMSSINLVRAIGVLDQLLELGEMKVGLIRVYLK